MRQEAVRCSDGCRLYASSSLSVSGVVGLVPPQSGRVRTFCVLVSAESFADEYYCDLRLLVFGVEHTFEYG
jgi:hypothetical protein